MGLVYVVGFCSQPTVRTQAHVVLLPPSADYRSVGDNSVDSARVAHGRQTRTLSSLGGRRGELRYTYTSLWLFPVLPGKAVVHPTSRMFIQHQRDVGVKVRCRPETMSCL